VRGVPGQLLQGGRDDPLDLVQQNGRRPAGALLVVQPVQPLPDEPAPPAGHAVLGGPQAGGDLLAFCALGAGQQDPRPQRLPLQLLPLGIGQDQPSLAPAQARAV
jgi:hypothetical protein